MVTNFHLSKSTLRNSSEKILFRNYRYYDSICRDDSPDQGSQSYGKDPRLAEYISRKDKRHDKKELLDKQDIVCDEYNKSERSNVEKRLLCITGDPDKARRRSKSESDISNTKANVDEEDVNTVLENASESNVEHKQCEIKKNKISYTDYQERKQLAVKTETVKLEETR